MQTCRVKDCENKSYAKVLCKKHYSRWLRNGTTRDLKKKVSLVKFTYPISYMGVHKRLQRLRGPAKYFECIVCLEPAQNWAFMHNCSQERVDSLNRKYCHHVRHYQPMCAPCHSIFDKYYRNLPIDLNNLV